LSQWSFACTDWADRLANGLTPIADLPLDRKEADAALQLFGALRLPDVIGQPALRSAAGQWQNDVVAAIFGSVDSTTGARRVGEVFELVPKKNAKTTKAAAIALTYMLRNRRPHADMMIVAPTQKIAETAFEQAAGMIDAGLDIEGVEESWLRDRLHVREHRKAIECRVTGAKLAIKSFDTKILTGSKPVLCLVDETHELGSVPYAHKVFRQIRGGMAPFPESCFIQITTQSDGRPQGIFQTELDYARKVRDGVITDRVKTLPVLYEFPDEVQTSEEQTWRDSKFWPWVTPNMSRSVHIETMKDDFARAEADGPDALRGWATQHLNVEVGKALHSDRWIGADFWPSAARADLGLEEILATSDVAVVGGDVGGLDDLFGAAVIGRHAVTSVWQAWCRAYCCPIVWDRRKDIAAELDRFKDAGDLVECETLQGCVEAFVDDIDRVRNAGILALENGVGLDHWKSSLVEDELHRRNYPDLTLAGVGQGWKLAGPAQLVAARLQAGTMVHSGQGLMLFSVENAKVDERGENQMISKARAGYAKIDPLIALLNAAMLMSMGPSVQDASLDDYFQALKASA